MEWHRYRNICSFIFLHRVGSAALSKVTCPCIFGSISGFYFFHWSHFSMLDCLNHYSFIINLESGHVSPPSSLFSSKIFVSFLFNILLRMSCLSDLLFENRAMPSLEKLFLSVDTRHSACMACGTAILTDFCLARSTGLCETRNLLPSSSWDLIPLPQGSPQAHGPIYIHHSWANFPLSSFAAALSCPTRIPRTWGA